MADVKKAAWGSAEKQATEAQTAEVQEDGWKLGERMGGKGQSCGQGGAEKQTLKKQTDTWEMRQSKQGQAAEWEMEGRKEMESRKETEETTHNGIDMEQFGRFVSERRREKGLTQRQLAEKLFLSNKAVSKWERGLSLPDVALLEPLSQILGVTVTELLHGAKSADSGTAKRELTAEEIERLMMVSTEMSDEERTRLKGIKQNRAAWYFIGLFLSTAETALLFIFREKLAISLFDVAMDMLLVNPLILFIGIWPFFFMPEKLPPVYDKTRISGYGDGFFRISVYGISFNNRNWPHIMKAIRTFCFLAPVCWPLAYVPIHWAVPEFIWLYGRIFVELAFMLGGLFLPVVVLGKKYE